MKMDLSNRISGRLPVLLAGLALFAGGVPAQQPVKLDTTQFLVLGEGLGAGMADFALRQVYQEKSFGAQMARQMKAIFPQPLIQSPGIGSVPGFPALPPRLPGTLQGSVRADFPPDLFVFNLSVPGLRLADSLTRRPVPPLIQERDSQQTVINLILGYPTLIAGALLTTPTTLPLWSQAEYAVALNPTFVIVELGYYDVLEPAVLDNPSLLPDVTTFGNNLTTLLAKLKASNPQILVMTIPDPFDTAFFTTVANVTKYTGTPADALGRIFRLKPDDLLTPNGMMLVGGLIVEDSVGPLLSPLFPGLASFFPGTVVSSATQAAVHTRVLALNSAIVNAAKTAGANVYDLQALFSRVRTQGIQAGNKKLTADMLGGFYSLDGYYPGVTGHTLIANELLTFLNSTYKTSYPLLDLATAATSDPVVGFTPAVQKRPNDKKVTQ